MVKIRWCFNKKAFELVLPNRNLAAGYLKKSEDALSSMHVNVVKEWKISTAYYCIYFALYSVLMRIGIKCEIHKCTLAFVRSYLKDYFNAADFKFFEDSLQARVDAQYYTDRSVSEEQYSKMMHLTPSILVRCKEIVEKLRESEIENIRKAFLAS